MHNLLSGQSDTEQGLLENAAKSREGGGGGREREKKKGKIVCILTAFRVIYTE